MTMGGDSEGSGHPALPGQGGTVPPEFTTTPAATAFGFVGPTAAAAAAGPPEVAALAASNKWSSVEAGTGQTVITYSFADPHTSTFAYPDFAATLTALSEADRALAREMLGRIAAVCNIRFEEVPDTAEVAGILRYGYSQHPNTLGLAGYAFFPAAEPRGGDVWLGAEQASALWDWYRPKLILHETLHALGLKHPFGSGAVLPSAQNIIPNTVMSYSPIAGSPTGTLSRYPAEPMALDIAALQALYGPAATAAGDSRYDLAGAEFQGGFKTIWDAGGRDLLDASGLTRGVTLDLDERGASNIGVVVHATATVDGAAAAVTYTATLSIAAAAVIEDARGTLQADTIRGNAVANRLAGEAGDDNLFGGGGDDVLDGGPGNDFLAGGEGLDTALYHLARPVFGISGGAGGHTVTDPDGGTDTLLGVERLVFNDTRVALDLHGHAGTAAKILGAVFGLAVPGDPAAAGLALALLDGGMSGAGLAQAALDLRLGGAPSHPAVVDLLYANVAGTAPSAAEHAHYVQLLEQGTHSQITIAQFAAETPRNLANIDFVGLASQGLAYTV